LTKIEGVASVESLARHPQSIVVAALQQTRRCPPQAWEPADVSARPRTSRLTAHPI